MRSLLELRDALSRRETSSAALVEACLANAGREGGEGARVFIEIFASAARERAAELDSLRRRGQVPSPWAGIPIAVKDLFDIEGQITRAGSVLLERSAPAPVTAPAIARLEDAGLVIVGRTNMTEFAYSGVGINPHFDTPRCAYDRATGRIPGGSSSGSAVAVTDGMAAAGIGTDTGGSCRIPAALNGICGFKPTASRVPLNGVYPLAPSLDSVGPLAPTVGCCAVLDDIMAGGQGWIPDPVPPTSVRLAVLEHYATDGMDAQVGSCYQQTLARLEEAGFHLEAIRLEEVESLPSLNARGGIAAAEAYAHHRAQLESNLHQYDPRVGARIRAGAQVGDEELTDIRAARRSMIDAFGATVRGQDAMILPTVPITAPPLAAFEKDDEYVRLNLLLLRNPSLINFLDGCAISVPIHDPGSAPVGLMLAGPGGTDRQLLRVAAAAEAALADGRAAGRR